MVLVDVFVPSVDKTYNFSLNETVEIQSVIAEITEMIEQKERVTLVGDRSGLYLYNAGSERVLPKGNTLADCAIGNGSRLILV